MEVAVWKVSPDVAQKYHHNYKSVNFTTCQPAVWDFCIEKNIHWIRALVKQVSPHACWTLPRKSLCILQSTKNFNEESVVTFLCWCTFRDTTQRLVCQNLSKQQKQQEVEWRFLWHESRLPVFVSLLQLPQGGDKSFTCRCKVPC